MKVRGQPTRLSLCERTQQGCSMPADRNLYPRPDSNRSSRSNHVAVLIDQLRELERQTDPKNGRRSARGKDLAAREALTIANDLVQAVAGWALDHVAGLVLKDLNSVSLTTATPPVEHSEVTPTNDDH